MSGCMACRLRSRCLSLSCCGCGVCLAGCEPDVAALPRVEMAFAVHSYLFVVDSRVGWSGWGHLDALAAYARQGLTAQGSACAGCETLQRTSTTGT